MKNTKRAYRRYKQYVVLKRRAKKWYSGTNLWIANGNRHSWAEYWKEVQSGEIDSWLKWTGTPCSCWMCAGENKYQRPTKEQVRKIIEEGLDDCCEDNMRL